MIQLHGKHPLWTIFLAEMVVLCITHSMTAEPSPGDLAQVEILQNTLATIAETVRPSVVAIRATRPVENSSPSDETQATPDDGIQGDTSHRSQSEEQKLPVAGSGVIINSNGLILTNEHVIARARLDDITCILSDGTSHHVQDIACDPRSDLAVLKIDMANLKSIPLGDLNTVKQGHFAIVMGNPFGSTSESQGQPTMSFGIISALGRGLTRQLDPTMTQRFYGNLIQTDAKVYPGNSGGPLLNIKGEVIGINTAISSRSSGNEGAGYAIPMNKRNKDIIAKLARFEEVEYGFLGVGLRSTTAADRRTTSAPAGGGAVVESVELGTPAANANLQVGDIIVAYDEQPVADDENLIDMVGATPIGRTANLAILRDQGHQIVPVTIARRKMLSPDTLTWRGMKLAYPDWEICRIFKLAVDVQGVVVSDVETSGPAAKAGLESGQGISELNGIRIQGIRHLRRITNRLTGPVTLSISGETQKQVTLP